ncbi:MULTISPECIES: hypothetical protein [Clostridium]|jgi:hypothetical protein|uniref:Uncharacterized protein n=3 Tax=Clostridium TaxID=1485 RepID=A0A1S8R4D7_CLOBE|nr:MULTISPECIES: hypothetical protein [Clostridium]ABR34802.1 hypothetical protein Cbei_2648 [Clostridium beijerinckii NCIMB 8052]AIU05014.1 hypothetical protein Cbs_2648 [Clostridium beijerinckii ATCC 35702]MBA8934704.1 hypothetical protein [Clostridium beijerinckii]MBC2458739.1 hypothetical protein [Clostridium beijerinckii]MBC2475818.1 hypothetical protein [Clostridium beijerinckii]
MKDVNVDTIKETIKYLPEDEQEIILHLTEIFEGEEENINEYVKNELIGE